jgi:hypothetical protein
MTVEIRELVIRASVVPADAPALSEAALAALVARLKPELLRECAARVLEELDRAQQRQGTR